MRWRAREFDRFDLKTRGDMFDRFGPQNRGGLDAVKDRAEGMWRHHEACVETKRGREGGVSVCDSYKKIDEIVLALACTVIRSLGIF